MSKSMFFLLTTLGIGVGTLIGAVVIKVPALIFISLFALVLIAIELFLRTVRAYTAKKRSETALAYTALGAWGDFSDPDADAFIQGWLDQVLNPAVPAPVHRTEAAKAAYQSGWIASRDRDLDALSTADRVL